MSDSVTAHVSATRNNTYRSDSVVESGRSTTTQAQASDRGLAAGINLLGNPVETRDDVGDGARAAVGEDLNSDEAGLLGNTEGGASSSTTRGLQSAIVSIQVSSSDSRDVGTVAVAVLVGVATEGLAPAGTAAEVGLLWEWSEAVLPNMLVLGLLTWLVKIPVSTM